MKRLALPAMALAAATALTLAPAGGSATPDCDAMKEEAGCKLKSGGYTGTTKSGGDTYGLLLTIGSNGYSSARGAVMANCSGGDPFIQKPGPYLVPTIQTLKLPKRLTIGKTYEKSGHVDRVDDTGQTKVRVVSNETVKVKMISARRAKVTLSVDTRTRNVEPPSEYPAWRCVGKGSEKLKRSY